MNKILPLLHNWQTTNSIKDIFYSEPFASKFAKNVLKNWFFGTTDMVELFQRSTYTSLYFGTDWLGTHFREKLMCGEHKNNHLISLIFYAKLCHLSHLTPLASKLFPQCGFALKNIATFYSLRCYQRINSLRWYKLQIN